MYNNNQHIVYIDRSVNIAVALCMRVCITTYMCHGDNLLGPTCWDSETTYPSSYEELLH